MEDYNAQEYAPGQEYNDEGGLVDRFAEINSQRWSSLNEQRPRLHPDIRRKARDLADAEEGDDREYREKLWKEYSALYLQPRNLNNMPKNLRLNPNIPQYDPTNPNQFLTAEQKKANSAAVFEFERQLQDQLNLLEYKENVRSGNFSSAIGYANMISSPMYSSMQRIYYEQDQYEKSE
jgi:hypothetical protein